MSYQAVYCRCGNQIFGKDELCSACQRHEKGTGQLARIATLEAENARLKVAGDALAATLKRDGECSCLGDQTCEGCADLAKWDMAKGTK